MNKVKEFNDYKKGMNEKHPGSSNFPGPRKTSEYWDEINNYVSERP